MNDWYQAYLLRREELFAQVEAKTEQSRGALEEARDRHPAGSYRR